MISIPPHYSDRYISQRYNKALYIVQHLPNSSNVQPTKDQRLELYSFYKQVSQGNINTPRPGIFDVVGRAKWDAWKKLEGITELKAKHAYVEILLQVAMEAYKKPAGRAQAHQIIQSFAAMQPLGDSGDSSSEEDSSVGSTEAEELAYLRQVERATPTRRQPAARVWRGGGGGSRASSRASSTGQLSMRTAPTEFGRLSQSSSRSGDIRPMSVPSNNVRRRVYDENFDESVNPWVMQSSSMQYTSNRPGSSSQQDIYRSPVSASSSVTATQYNNSVASERFALGGRSLDQHVLLGPATKRAIESIQLEIEALNERINGLRKEIVDRDSKRNLPKKPKYTVQEEGWKWVIKAALKHATMNLITTLLLFLVLYKNQSPIAKAIIRIIQNMEEVNLIKRPTLLRSPPSIQLTTFTAHAIQQQQQLQINEEKAILYPSRTQHKMMLQRQSFLADDKNYLDHPDNMRRLTKELDRVNREYRCVKQFQDPLALSIQRISQSCPTSLYTPSIPSLKRRASHDYLLHFKEERRHSTGFIGRIFGKRHSPLFF